MLLEAAVRKLRFDRRPTWVCAAFLGIKFKRLVIWLLVPHHLAEIALVDLLAADRAFVKSIVPV
ncbi:hypothetical protein X767_19640 [Mesorhizobium sp. LSJC264A00]|nr:hypothetical protein X767_19640 [Mesorhizobium sp. LSJC264A00]